MNLKITMLIGPSCSGKSTRAKQFLEENASYVRVSKEDICKMLRFNPVLTLEQNVLMREIYYEAIESALYQGYNVLLDGTHTHIKSIQDIQIRFGELADIDFMVMKDVALNELFSRSEERSKLDGYRPVPKHVIESMFNKFNNLKQQFDFKEIKKNNK